MRVTNQVLELERGAESSTRRERTGMASGRVEKSTGEAENDGLQRVSEIGNDHDFPGTAKDRLGQG
jgi:hypothetical protein